MAGSDKGWPYPGARWWKFDFHTHTPASHDYGKGTRQAKHKQIMPEDWLRRFMQADVDCVAVTDHNSGEWIDQLKETLEAMQASGAEGFRPLHLFPGVEVTANGGIHILAVFGPDKTGSDIAALLGSVKYQGERGASDIAAESAPISVVEAILDAGGIPVPAHVDAPSGLWKLRGNTLAPLLDADMLLACEVVDPASTPPELYQRKRLNWAEVLGSDSHHPDSTDGDRYPGSHYTWVKMAHPSLEGLRLALIDGNGLSIRRSDDSAPFDPLGLPKHIVEAIEIGDARFMGRREPSVLKFSPWLNALVGGRGTGKSTVIHGIRLAANRAVELNGLDSNSVPRSTFEAFNRVPTQRVATGGLQEDTLIRLTLMRDGVRYRLQWRADGGGAVVQEDGSPGWKPSEIQSVTPERFPLRIFSQGQIAALAGENQQALMQVIDDAGGVAEHQRELNASRDAFFATQARIRGVATNLEDADRLAVEKEDVERKLKRFEEAGHTEVLTRYRRRQRQSREVERQLEAVAKLAEQIDGTASEMHPEDIPDGLFSDDPEDREVGSILASLAESVRGASQALEDQARALREAAAEHRDRLSGGAWHRAVDEAARAYEELIDALRTEGVSDPNEYGRLVQERGRLDGELGHLESLESERKRLVGVARDQRLELQDQRRAVSDARARFLEEILAQNPFVHIRCREYGQEPRVVERSLREVLGVLDDRFASDILTMDEDRAEDGIVARLLTSLPDDPTRRRAEFENRIGDLKRRIEEAAAGGDAFGGAFNNFLARECGKTPDLLDRLLAWFPEDALVVEYSRLGDGKDFQPIAQASAGQRSAAMLAFLLAHGEEPLVLDQPEDDLDNHLIYDLVVRQIRENKSRRQIIVVTHNPNIVVNGDAEMLHALDFVAGQCKVVKSGSLQDKAMREEVCRVMEGGREAFERRYRRLGREPA
ncbi:MAG: AAA family ATPase [Rhodospirillaceae bacterium]|nr:AAA family ATPase [Rhodospirillaceae bacterium]